MAKSDSSPRLIEIPRITDPRGNLSFVQHPGVCPFDIERVYWLYDVPARSVREGRALKTTDEVIISLSGAFDVHTVDGNGARADFHLDCCYKGLYLPAGTWRTIDNFVTNSVVMILASRPYDKQDYIRSYEDFIDKKYK